MKKQELVSILVTLVFGFFAGGYLYLNVFTAMIQPDSLETAEELDAFSITSQAYGGCRSNCPAFRLMADGSYRYQYVPSIGAAPVVRSGTLPLRLQRDLDRALEPRDLRAQAQSVVATNCASATDGIDIEYEVEIEGELFVLDSCRSAVDPRSDAWLALSAVWTYFSEVAANE